LPVRRTSRTSVPMADLDRRSAPMFGRSSSYRLVIVADLSSDTATKFSIIAHNTSNSSRWPLDTVTSRDVFFRDDAIISAQNEPLSK